MTQQEQNYLQGFELTYENAKELFTAAEILETKKKFSIANSLLILSVEEAVKAYILFSQHLFPEENVGNIEDFFNDHSYKLDSIRNLIAFSNLMKKMLELFYEPVIKNIDEPDEIRLPIRKQSFENLIAWMEQES